MVTAHERGEAVMVATGIGMREQRPRALVLDGDPGARDALRHSLATRSFAVLSAGDATSGLRILLDELLDLDVLVVELELPHRNARSLAHLVRRAGGEQDLPIVVVAGEIAPGLRAELYALGVDAIADRREGSAAVAEVVLDVLADRRRAADAGFGFAFEALPTLAA